MKIILDGMGGDHAPDAIVTGAADVSRYIEHDIVIYGDEEKINKILKPLDYDTDRIEIVHTSEVIENEDSPVKAIRRKTDSSIVKGLEALRDGRGDVFLSAGNSGAVMSGGILILGRIDGIDRPAIGSPYPILSGGGGSSVALLIDAGANAECKPHNLLQFAVMGSVYAKCVLGIADPRVGLVNMGVEAGKGGSLEKGAYELLNAAKDSESGLGFIGNIEARDIPIGICDVIVCDGFVGNVLLKTTEGVGLSIMHLIREKFSEGLVAKAGAALLLNKLTDLKKVFDYTEHGGAPLLGLSKPVVKMHGSSNAKAVRAGIARAIHFAEEDVVGAIAEMIKADSNIGG